VPPLDVAEDTACAEPPEDTATDCATADRKGVGWLHSLHGTLGEAWTGGWGEGTTGAGEGDAGLGLGLAGVGEGEAGLGLGLAGAGEGEAGLGLGLAGAGEGDAGLGLGDREATAAGGVSSLPVMVPVLSSFGG
jgi:hypothetical protein